MNNSSSKSLRRLLSVVGVPHRSYNTRETTTRLYSHKLKCRSLETWPTRQDGTSDRSHRLYSRSCLSLSYDASHDPKGKGGLLLTEVLEDKISQGIWRSDPIQRRAARRLERLQTVLSGYCNHATAELCMQALDQQKVEKKNNPSLSKVKSVPSKNESFREGNFARKDDVSRRMLRADNLLPGSKHPDSKTETEVPPIIRSQIPRGLYIYGPVGVGKSMLMDVFYENVQTEGAKKRFHFHAFMSHVHERIHNLKKEQLEKEGRNFAVDTNPKNNPIRRVAQHLGQELSLLCLDEFQVTDIADALILSQLFSVLWKMGTVVVATSNRLPSQLYEGGLNRSYFLPFIDLLEKHCIVHTLNSDTDYRVALSLESSLESFFYGGSHAVGNHMNAFDEVLSQLRQSIPSSSVTLEVSGRRCLHIERGDEEGWLADFRFHELCEVEMGASDYRTLAQNFAIVAVREIPTLLYDTATTISDLDRARRFVILIDELYESKSTALLCSTVSAKDPHDIFRSGLETKESLAEQHLRDGNTVASVKELHVAFERAASRIFEMTSRRWWDSIIENRDDI